MSIETKNNDLMHHVHIINHSEWKLILPSKFLRTQRKHGGSTLDLKMPFTIAPQSSISFTVDKEHEHGSVVYRAFKTTTNNTDHDTRPRQICIDWTSTRDEEGNENSNVLKVNVAVYELLTHGHPVIKDERNNVLYINQSQDKNNNIIPIYLQHKLTGYKHDELSKIPLMKQCQYLKCIISPSSISSISYIQLFNHDQIIPNDIKSTQISSSLLSSINGDIIMETLLNNYPQMNLFPLDYLTFIGSHDSGAYNMSRRGKVQHILGKTFIHWSQCQTMNIREQLHYGIRSLDIRIALYNDNYYIVHGPVLGPKLDDVLSDIYYFLSNTRKEILLVHFVPQNLKYDNDDETNNNNDDNNNSKFGTVSGLAKHLKELFHKYLYVPSVYSDDNDILRPQWDIIGNIVRSTSRLIGFYRSDYCTKDSLLCREDYIIGKWINTSNLSMKLNGLYQQLSNEKLKISLIPEDNITRRLYNLQWTLTPQISDTIYATLRIPWCRKSIQDLANETNVELYCFLSGLSIKELSKINIISTDFCEHFPISHLFMELNLLKHKLWCNQ